MSNDEVVLSGSVVGKVLEVARACVDEKRKGWFVNMKQFRDAMDALNLDSREVSEALAYLKARMYVITFPDADGGGTKISVVPQWHQCRFCKMWLDMQDEREHHIDDCLRRQAKMARNLRLLFGGQWQ